MATIFDDAPREIHDLLTTVMDQYHSDLLEAGVTVNLLLASNTKEGAPALKHHGHPAIALVKINSYADRKEGKADVTIKIDKDWWTWATADQRTATLDHELTHLELKREDDGKVALDDCGRPKLKMVPHDFEVGGFHSIARRHGRAAEEVQAVLGVRKAWKQMQFDFDAEKETEEAAA